MTATICSNSPTEVIDLLAILNTTYKKPAKLDKNDYFQGYKLKTEAIEKITELCKDRVSYIEDLDPSLYPKRIMTGTKIEGIEYLLFHRCKMPPLQQEKYDEAIKEFGNIPQDGKILTDMVVPTSVDTVDYLTKVIKQKLNDTSVAEKQELGINYKNKILSGNFLKLENIGKFSGKYSQLLRDIIDINAKNDGKMLIYHQYVYNSGVTCIAEILLENNFLDYTGMPSDNTVCAVCGKPRIEHKVETLQTNEIQLISEQSDKERGNSENFGTSNSPRSGEEKGGHLFIPARFMLVHSDMDPNLRTSKLNAFNDPRNTMGYQFKILIGSRIIQEREDFKAIRHLLVLRLPYNISSLIQVFGRAVRRGSHLLLPENMREVFIHIYVSSINNSDKLSVEEDYYKTKMLEYLVIQTIEKIFNMSAIDAPIFMKQQDMATLTSLPYTRPPLPNYDIDKDMKLIFQGTYSREEIETIKYIIKRLFLEISRVFNKIDLYKHIRKPTFFVPTNPIYFLDENIETAINELLYSHTRLNLPPKTFIQSITTTSNVIKTPDNVDNVIINTGKFYILIPMQKIADISYYGTDARTISGFPILDIDSWQRNVIHPNNISVSIGTFKPSYDVTVKKFYHKYKNIEDKYLIETINDFDLEFHEEFIKEIIKYVFMYLKTGIISEMHDFYLKMMYIYDKIGAMILCSYLRGNPLYDKYDKYITKYESGTADNDDIQRHSNFLTNHIQHKSIRLQFSRFQEMKIGNKLPDTLIPVGYTIGKFILYEPDTNTWKPYNVSIDFKPKYTKENDIIIGYYEKYKSSLEMRFKLRLPTQQLMKFNDARKNEKGAYCSTYSKDKLTDICKKLKLDIGDAKITHLCNIIRKELIRRELEERRRYIILSEDEKRKHPLIRWFYLSFE